MLAVGKVIDYAVVGKGIDYARLPWDRLMLEYPFYWINVRAQFKKNIFTIVSYLITVTIAMLFDCRMGKLL